MDIHVTVKPGFSHCYSLIQNHEDEMFYSSLHVIHVEDQSNFSKFSITISDYLLTMTNLFWIIFFNL